MKIFAIGDLHLSGEPPSKPMDVFGDMWCNHWDRIKRSWLARVTPQDVVLLAGDISWALTMEQAREDLQRLVELPGQKVLVRGNHDYWWSSLKKLNDLYAEKGLFFLQNNYCAYGDVAVCGSRSWDLPTSLEYSPEDERIFRRELLRIEMSLRAAAGYRKKVLMLHYPPLLADGVATKVSELCQRYAVDVCIYGHLHGQEYFSIGFEGWHQDTFYKLVSADSLQFELWQLDESFWTK